MALMHVCIHLIDLAFFTWASLVPRPPFNPRLGTRLHMSMGLHFVCGKEDGGNVCVCDCHVPSTSCFNSGINLESNYVGIAFTSSMCSGLSSVGVTQDGRRRLLSYTGSTAAHELGHILNMRHDNSPSEYSVVRKTTIHTIKSLPYCPVTNIVTMYPW